MIPGPEIRRSLRRGFTMVELLVVITIIILLSGIFLSLNPGDGGGLSAGQQMLASSIRSLRAMALMNRGAASSQGMSYNLRYRLLILNDPTDLDNHLRRFVLAVGGGADPATKTDDAINWVSPAPASVLPKGVYFMPPDAATKINQPAGGLSQKRALSMGLSIIGAFPDSDLMIYPQGAFPYMPVGSAMNSSDMTLKFGDNLKNWYFVELQPGGASNHIGRVVLVLASGRARLGSATSQVEIDLAGDGKLAAISLRPNGDVTLTNDSDDLTTDTLKQ